MLNKIKDYINDKEFRLTVFIDRIHIINYSQIIIKEKYKMFKIKFYFENIFRVPIKLKRMFTN